MQALILGAQNGALTLTGTGQFQPLEGGNGTLAGITAEGDASQVIPHALTLDLLTARVENAPGTGKSWTVTVWVNGSASTLTCTISDTNKTAQDTGHPLSLNVGDTVSVKWVPSGTPAAPGTISWYTRQAASGKFAVLAGTTTAVTATRFCSPQGSQTGNATETSAQAPIPIAGVISNLRVKLSTAPGGSGGTNQWTITVRKTAANAGPSVTIQDANTTGTDGTNTASISAGDLVDIDCAVAAGAPASTKISASYTFTPTTDGDAFWSRVNSNSTSGSTTNYDVISGAGGGTYATVEADRQQVVGPATLKAFYTKLGNAPGGSTKTYVFTVRKNAAATTLTISDSSASTNHASNITGLSATTVDLDLLAFESAPTNSPFGTVASSGIYYVYNGVTSVQKTLTTSFNIQNTIAKTVTTSFTIKTAVAKTVTPAFTIKQTITKAVTPTFSIISRITKSITASFNIHAFPKITVAAAISGTPLTGQVLTASATFATDPVDPVTKTYKWRVETGPGTGVFVDIPGETASTLQL